MYRYIKSSLTHRDNISRGSNEYTVSADVHLRVSTSAPHGAAVSKFSTFILIPPGIPEHITFGTVS
jgi:hypothetical protein